MARVKFTKNFDYKPTPSTTIGYLAGMEMTVKQECADKAIAAGAAKSMDKPRKETSNGES